MMKNAKRNFTTIVSQNWNTLENASLRAKLPYAFLFDIILSVAKWIGGTVCTMNLFLWGALPYIAFTFLIVEILVPFFTLKETGLQNRVNFREKQLRIANPLFHFWPALRYRWSRSRCVNP